MKKYELVIKGSTVCDSDSLKPLVTLLIERLNTSVTAYIKDTATDVALLVMESGDITYIAPDVAVSSLRDLCAKSPEYGKMLICQGLVVYKGANFPMSEAMYDGLTKLHEELFGPVDVTDLFAVAVALAL